MADKGPSLSSETPLGQDLVSSAPFTTAALSLQEAWEIDSTCSQILHGDFRKVALQFPDELLHEAVPVYQAIRDKLPIEIELYVLADTTFGSCCIDEVAAEHVSADLVVHYGHACMSPTVRLPVIYIFGKKAVDLQHASTSLADLLREAREQVQNRNAGLLMYDVAYEWKSEELATSLERCCDLKIYRTRVDRSAAPSKGKTRIATDNPEYCKDMTGETVPSRRRFDLPEGIEVTDCVIFWLGDESLSLTNLIMTHPTSLIISYSPTKCQARVESIRSNRMLMRRYVVTQKAKDSDVFGIVVGTLGVASYLPLISRLRSLLRKHKKKAYTLAVGKLNPAKLANYQVIECFVLVACGENSLVEGAKDFYRPIVTPFELEVALGERAWTGSDYILDFDRLLLHTKGDRPGKPGTDDDDDAEDDGAPVFSAVTGKYRTAKVFRDTILDPDLGTLAVREGGRAVAEAIGSAAGLHLAERSYRGLDPRFGQDGPAPLEQGRSGLARAYADDH